MSDINLEGVRFTILPDGGKVKALCGFKLNGILFVTGCRLIEGSKGLFLSWPSRKVTKEDGTAEYKDICFPASKEVRNNVEAQILDEWDKQTGEPKAPAAAIIPF